VKLGLKGLNITVSSCLSTGFHLPSGWTLFQVCWALLVYLDNNFVGLMLMQISATLSYMRAFCVATYIVTVLTFSHLGFPSYHLPAVCLKPLHSDLLTKLPFRQPSTETFNPDVTEVHKEGPNLSSLQSI